MFEVALLTGIYAYGILLIGLAGMLYAPIVCLFTLLFVGGGVWYYKKRLQGRHLQSTFKESIRHAIVFFRKDIIFSALLLLILLQEIINFIGVLGPELAFDSLWYHLTLPKIYLMHHTISYIPGGLFYYSTMPKLLELLYTGGLAFGSQVFPKLIHFLFGVATLIVLYKLARKYLSQRLSLLVVGIFYANLVVGWESISAYIDLGRTFFEILSVYAFIEWTKEKDKKYFYYSALCLGLAITTKLLAIGSLCVMLLLVGSVLHRRKEKLLKPLVAYMLLALIVPLPWFVFSLINTGNPFYPFFSHTYPVPFPWQLLNPWYLVTSFWNMFLFSADPINPMYLICLPLIIFFYRKLTRSEQSLFLYTLGGLFFWYCTPQTGGGRFILPYLSVFSLLCVVSIVRISVKRLQQLLIFVAILLSLSSVVYRGVANAKFIPVIFHRESTTAFLTKHLNFSFGDFADTDGYFATHIKSTDTVLLYGFHNEYYVDFPFIDSSFVKKGDVFTYIATQDAMLPKRFQTWNLVYTNPTTHVALYSIGGIPWVY